MLISADQRRLLSSDPWFGDLSSPLQELFLRSARTKQARDGEHIYRVGEPPDGLYAMLEGEAQLIAYPSVGSQLLYMVMRPGNWFGQLSVIDNGPRPHDAISAGSSSLLHLRLRDFEVLADAEPALYRALALLGCRQQRAVMHYVGLLLAHAPEVRLAALLLEMTARKGSTQDQPLQAVHVTQEALAKTVGVSRQTLNRLVQGLETAGWIQSRYGVITIMDRDGLEMAAAGQDASPLP